MESCVSPVVCTQRGSEWAEICSYASIDLSSTIEVDDATLIFSIRIDVVTSRLVFQPSELTCVSGLAIKVSTGE